MKLKPLDIVLLEGDKIDIAERIVMESSGSAFSHCVTCKNKQGDVFDATLGGILDRNIKDYAGRYFTICRFKENIPDTKVKEMLAWCEEKQRTCEGYDILAWLGFATRIRYFESENRWYCSELPYWMYEEAGYSLTVPQLTFVYPNFFLLNAHFANLLRGGDEDDYNFEF